MRCHSNQPSFLHVALGQEPQTCVSSNKTCCTRQLETTLQQKAMTELHAKVLKRLHGVKGSTAAIQVDVRGTICKIEEKNYLLLL